MKRQKLSLNKLEVKSFTTETGNDVKGGVQLTLGPLFCTAFCGTGATCPECAFTIDQPECPQP